jgi:hypothetical protein
VGGWVGGCTLACPALSRAKPGILYLQAPIPLLNSQANERTNEQTNKQTNKHTHTSYDDADELALRLYERAAMQSDHHFYALGNLMLKMEAQGLDTSNGERCARIEWCWRYRRRRMFD